MSLKPYPKTKLPLLLVSPYSSKKTTALTQLGETEGELEVQNAFELNLKYYDQPMHLLLVDYDLITGATLATCASSLIKKFQNKNQHRITCL